MTRTYGTVVVLTLALLMVSTVTHGGGPSTDSAAATPAVDDSTRAMAELLKERAAMVDPLKLAFAINDRRAERMREEFLKLPPSAARRDVQLTFAIELLRAGRFEDSLRVLDVVQEDGAKSLSAERMKELSAYLLMLRSMAHMRMAEEQNCCQRGNRDSCLLPIRGEGIHTQRAEGVRAVATLEEELSIVPDNLEARWLLNIAHMTLGSYPAGVPAARSWRTSTTTDGSTS